MLTLHNYKMRLLKSNHDPCLNDVLLFVSDLDVIIIIIFLTLFTMKTCLKERNQDTNYELAFELLDIFLQISSKAF